MTNITKNDKIIFALLFILTIGILFAPQTAQYVHYHDFGDQRTLFHVPHFWNIVTNIPFAIVGLIGVRATYIHVTDKTEKFFALLCFWSMASLVITSSYYHWQPNNWGVFIDRLSIVFSVVGLTGLVASRHISKLSGYATSIIGVIFGFFGLCYWYLTGNTPAEDLRFYALVQILPMILFPIILMISPKDNGKKYIILCLAWYGLGKVFEIFDVKTYEILLQAMSGHSLKHLVAAIGGYMVVKYVQTPSH